MERILVVGYGNPLRSDDGIAWQAAEQLREELPNTARIICVHQLTPELAEELRRANLVIFLDASSKGRPGSIRCQAVAPQSIKAPFSHHFAPAELLALCNRLYAVRPQAFLISIRGESFDYGQELSRSAAHAIPQAVVKVCQLVKHLNKQMSKDRELCSAYTDRAAGFSGTER